MDYQGSKVGKLDRRLDSARRNLRELLRQIKLQEIHIATGPGKPSTVVTTEEFRLGLKSILRDTKQAIEAADKKGVKEEVARKRRQRRRSGD